MLVQGADNYNSTALFILAIPIPHIACGSGGCATTTRSFSSLYSHVYRRHSDMV